MNFTKQSYNDKKYSSMPYFTYTLRHNWQQLMFFLVIILLVMILPVVIYVGNSSENGPLDAALIGVYSRELTTFGSVGIFLSCALGLYSGMTALSYVNNKQNITCRHSLPLKRSAYFVIEPSVCLIYFIISILAGFAAVYSIMSVLCKGQLTTGSLYLAQLLAAVCGYLLVYASTLFSAGLTGTGVVRFLMTFVVMFLPYVLYSLIIESIGFGSQLNYISIDSIRTSDLLNTGYYENGVICELLCPIVYIAECIFDTNETPFIVSRSLLTLPHTAILTAGAFFLHKYRRTEDTGKTIIWKPVFAVVKYLVIFTSSILGMFIIVMLNSASNTDYLNIILGALIGFVLSFMAVNCVMYRSTRAIFKGIKPALILAAAVLVFIIVVPMNKLGLCVNLYSPDNTKYIVLQNGGVSVTVEDGLDEVVELLNARIDELEQNGDDYRTVVKIPGIYSDDGEVQAVLDEKFADYTLKSIELENKEKYGDMDYDRMYEEKLYDTMNMSNTVWSDSIGRRELNIYQKPKFGVTLAIRLVVPLDSPLWSMYIESEEYADSMDLSGIDSNSVEEINIAMYNDTVNIIEPNSNKVMIEVETHEADGRYKSFERSFADYRAYVESIIDHCKFDLERYRTEPIVGNIDIRLYEEGKFSKWVNFPICAGDLELINAAGELIAEVSGEDYKKAVTSEDSVIKSLKNCTTAIMVDTATGEARLTDVETVVKSADNIRYLPNNGEYFDEYVIPEDTGYVFMVYEQTNEQEFAAHILSLRDNEGGAVKAQLREIYDSLK